MSGFELIFAPLASSSPVSAVEDGDRRSRFAIYPACAAVQLLLGPWSARGRLPLRVLLTTLILVPFMVWAGVPWLTRRLDRWLHRT